MEFKGLHVETQGDMLLKPAGRLAWQRVTVTLPPGLWDRVKKQALEARVSANEIARAVLGQWLDKAEKE